MILIIKHPHSQNVFVPIRAGGGVDLEMVKVLPDNPTKPGRRPFNAQHHLYDTNQPEMMGVIPVKPSGINENNNFLPVRTIKP